MGVNCKLYLPGNVRVLDVVNVIGKLIGLPSERSNLRTGSWSCSVMGISYRHSPCPEMVIIESSEKKFLAFYHFEQADGTRLVSFRSYPDRIALAQVLADFFGGRVDYQDCDSSEADYVVPARSAEENSPEDGEPWQRLQERIEAVQPLTREQIRQCEQWAAYRSE